MIGARAARANPAPIEGAAKGAEAPARRGQKDIVMTQSGPKAAINPR
jgi:hypothetical protein